MAKIYTLLLALLLGLVMVVSVDRAGAEANAPASEMVQRPPNVASIDVQSSSSITYFKATSSRVRGRIDLSWSHTGKSFTGYFVVERSSNGSAWRSVSACTLRYSTTAKGSYSCSDTGLASGTTYSYRACIVAKGTACSSGSATKAVSVKAP